MSKNKNIWIEVDGMDTSRRTPYYNKKGIIQGSEVDSEIDEEGVRQSKLFYDYY